MLDEKLLVFVLGAPGAGKGTQCDLIVKEYGWTHISAGDLLRAQVKAGTPAGKEAEEYLKQGTMVPASMIIGLLKDALCEAQHTKVLIDGFPRVFDQLKEFEKQVRPCNKALFYKIEEAEARARLMKRSETSGRVDDNEETIRNRFVVFKQESMPVITELEKEGRAVEVDASQPPEQVFAVTRLVIEELEQQQAQQAQAAAAVAAEGAPASPTAAAVQSPKAAEAALASPTAAAVQSPKVSTVLAAAGSGPTSPQPAVASAPGSTPASPQPAAASAIGSTPTSPLVPAAASALGSTPASPGIPAAAAAEAEAAAAAVAPTFVSPQAAAAVDVTPVSPQQAAAAALEGLELPHAVNAHSTPFSPAAQATSPSALGAAAVAAGTGAALAAAGAAAAMAAGSATSSPLKADLLVSNDTLASEPESAAVVQGSMGSPQASGAVLAAAAAAAAGMPAAVAVPPPGVPAELDVTSPTATSQGPPTPSTAMIGSLQVDLSGIRTPVLICGPSGVGKGTLIAKLMEQHPDRFGFSVSHTTRGPRPGEVHGKHYYFTDRESMSAQVAAGMFLEHADVHGNMYGTSLAAVAQVSAAGKHCVLDIDVQGAAQVRKSALGSHCLFIFVAPPSHEELERRLRNRGTETEDKVLQRLANATSEIAKAQEPGLFHHVLVNADLETAHQDLLKLIAQRVPGLLPTSQQYAGSSSQRTSEAGSTVTSPKPIAAAAAGEVAQSPTAAVASPGAGAGAVLAGAAAAAAVAAGGVAAVSPVQQQQSPLVNGNASTAPASGGTAALLDFGFGASAGHSSAPKGMPVRQYMDTTVIPVLREGLKALNQARPDDPLQFLADYLVSHKAAAA